MGTVNAKCMTLSPQTTPIADVGQILVVSGLETSSECLRHCRSPLRIVMGSPSGPPRQGPKVSKTDPTIHRAEPQVRYDWTRHGSVSVLAFLEGASGSIGNGTGKFQPKNPDPQWEGFGNRVWER